ncbi:MAG: hypothetical protein Q9184_003885 [Pyrenodesmia sp. 2 TL-2023]
MDGGGHNVPASPPAIPPSLAPTITLGAEPYSLSQFQSQTAEGLGTHETLSPGTNGRSLQESEEFVRPSLPANALQRRHLEAMGRLQSGPKSSTKPRLLSERLPDLAQIHKQANSTRPATSLIEQYNAAYGRSDDGK